MSLVPAVNFCREDITLTAELTSELCKHKESSMEKTQAFLKQRWSAFVSELSLFHFRTNETEFKRAWDAVCALPDGSSTVVHVVFAMGCPVLHGITIEAGPDGERPITITVTAPKHVAQSWRLSWLSVFVDYCITANQISAAVNPAQLEAMLLRLHSDQFATPVVTHLANFPSYTAAQMKHDAKVIVNMQRGEAYLLAKGMNFDFDARLAECQWAARELSRHTEGNHVVFLEKELRAAWFELRKTPVQVGVGWPKVFLVAASKKSEPATPETTAGTSASAPSSWFPCLRTREHARAFGKLVKGELLAAQRAIGDVAPEDRLLLAVTLRLDSAGRETCLARLSALHRKLHEISRKHGAANSRATYGHQLFPFTKLPAQIQWPRSAQAAANRVQTTQETHPWAMSVIREMAAGKNFHGTADWIQEALNFPVGINEIEACLRNLVKMRMLAFDEARHTYVQMVETVKTQEEVEGDTVVKYHESVLKAAWDAWETVDHAFLDFDVATFQVDAEGFDAIRSVVLEDSQEVLDIAAPTDWNEQIFQLNLQLIPR